MRKIIERMLIMCPAAWYIFLRSLQLSALLLFCAVVMLIDGRSHYICMCAVTIYENVPALLLIGLIASVCIEDMYT